MTDNLRLMPPRMNLGTHSQSPMCMPVSNRRRFTALPEGVRGVMGFPLPSWQRPFVWTESQNIRFMESAWLGLYLGTYTYNQTDYDSPLDNLLIDGQQRMRALELYLDDAFPVFGYRWSEVTEVDRRFFEMGCIFASYVVSSNDEDYLRSYYDMMNFGGTAHTEDQRATKALAMLEGTPATGYDRT